MVIIPGWNLHFKIIQTILSRTDERIVESRDICGHSKRRKFFIIDSKKLLNLIAIISFFSRISLFSFSIMLVSLLLCLLMFIKEVTFTFIAEKFSIFFAIEVVKIFKLDYVNSQHSFFISCAF